jgi:very-short-patch-repair endonuclease
MVPTYPHTLTVIPPLSLGRARKAKAVKLPQALSVGEETFALHMKALGLNPAREFQFHPERKWKIDFAFVEQKLGVKIDGGSRSHGRHNRADGFEADCIKLNAAVALGWRILRYTTEMVTRGAVAEQVATIIFRHRLPKPGDEILLSAAPCNDLNTMGRRFRVSETNVGDLLERIEKDGWHHCIVTPSTADLQVTQILGDL